MRRDNTFDPGKAKKIARIKYAERKVNSYIDWSMKAKGYLKYKELVEQQDKYGIKVY
jgi:hypothetical protein